MAYWGDPRPSLLEGDEKYSQSLGRPKVVRVVVRRKSPPTERPRRGKEMEMIHSRQDN